MKLFDFKVNQKGRVIRIEDNPVAAKLMEFGILPGANFHVLSKASFQGPIFIRIGNNRIALRKEEASVIFAE